MTRSDIARRSLRAALCAVGLLVAAGRPADAQHITYRLTDFLHGYASEGGIWTRPTPWAGVPIDYLKRTVNLGEDGSRAPSFSRQQRLFEWRGQYAASLSASGHAVVGHSLGSMLARETFIYTTAGRSNIRGIVAVGGPHQGTHLADSAEKARHYLAVLQNRIDNVERHSNILGVLVGIASLASGLPGSTVFGVIGFGFFYSLDPKLPMDAQLAVPILPAIDDLKPGSGTVHALNNNFADQAIPRANVTGRIGLQHALIKVGAALLDKDEAQMIRERNRGQKRLRTCTRVLAFTIIGIGMAGACNNAERMLERLDDSWGRWVNGSERRYVSTGGSLIGIVDNARNIPFDGIVSNERQRYPGLNDPSFDLPPLDGLNHQNLYKVPRGLNAISDAMLRIRMRPASPPLTGAIIDGPTCLRPYQLASWGAMPIGGKGPYTYTWKANGATLSSTTSVVTYKATATSFTLSVTVRDANLATASRSMYVTVRNMACPL